MALSKSERIWRSIVKENDNPVSVGYLPINLSISELTELFEQHWQGKRTFNIERAVALFTSIYIARYDTPLSQRSPLWHKGFTSVPGTMFSNWVGSNYSDYIDTLIRANILVSDNQYIVGAKAKAYKIHPAYTEKPGDFRKHYTIPYSDLKLLIKAYEARIYRKENAKRIETGRAKLWASAFNLTRCIDIETAQSDFTEMYSKGISHIGNRTLDECLMMLVRLSQGSGAIFNEKDEFGFRLHSPFTNLPKELRKYILIDGAPAVEIDFANSNGFYFGVIAQSPEAILNLMGKDIRREDVLFIANHYSSQYPDFMEFVDSAVTGTLYEFLVERVRIRGRKISRTTAKKIVMKFMNSSPDQFVHLKLELAKYLPTVVKVCNHLNANGSKAIPRLLQRVEATIIIDHIAVSLTGVLKQPFTTIHDSFLCSSDEADIVVQAIVDTHSGYGLAVPRIK